MRHIISLTIAAAILCGGLYLLYIQFFEAEFIKGTVVAGGGVAAFVGAAWLVAEIRDPAR